MRLPACAGHDLGDGGAARAAQGIDQAGQLGAGAQRARGDVQFLDVIGGVQGLDVIGRALFA